MLVSDGKAYELTPSGASAESGNGSTRNPATSNHSSAERTGANTLAGDDESSSLKKKKDEAKEDISYRTNKGLPGTRWTSLFMLILWGLSLTMREWRGVDWSHGSRAYCNDIEEDAGMDDDNLFQMCISHSAIFRVVTVAVALLVIQTVLTFCSVDFYDYYWWAKFPCFILFSFALLYPPATGFDDNGFTWVARVGAFIFIVFQQVILLDWAYSVNEALTANSRVVENVRGLATAAVGSETMSVLGNYHLMFLLGFSFFNIAVFATSMGLLFEYFGGSLCGENTTILTISLVGMIAAAVIQLGGSNGSLVTTSILSLYVAYLSYAAVSLNPDPKCNSSLADNSGGSRQYTYGLGPTILGMIVSFLSIVWVTLVTSRKITNVMNVGVLPGTALFSVLTGKSSGADGGVTGTRVDFAKQLRTSVVNLNLIFALIAFYIAMVMTNWGTLLDTSSKGDAKMATSIAAGSISMWMQASGAWIAIAMYIVALIMPNFTSCLPRSVWDLQFNA